MRRCIEEIFDRIHDRTPSNLVISTTIVGIVSTKRTKLLKWISMFITLLTRSGELVIATTHDIDHQFYEYLSLLRPFKIDVVITNDVDLLLAMFSEFRPSIKLFLVSKSDVEKVKRVYDRGNYMIVVIDRKIDDDATAILAASIIVYLMISLYRSFRLNHVFNLSDILSFSHGGSHVRMDNPNSF